LAGQLLTLAINIGFDNTIPSFGSSNLNLRNLVINSGSFQGWTVQQLFDEANKKIGGCAASTLSFSTFNDALTLINEGYDNGTPMNKFLTCPPPCTLSLSLKQDAITQVSCFDGSNGAINLTVSGGVAPVKFLWSNGSTSEDISNLSSGSYSVVATDVYGCTATILPVSLANPSPILISGSLTESTSCVCNGTATANVSGGKASYSYLWSNNATGTNSISSLCAGPVSVTVTDANGCKKAFDLGSVTRTEGCVATEIVSFTQKMRANGTPVNVDRSIPELALGVPQYNNAPGTFFSLGFGGNVVLKISGGIYDRPGNDLSISETTFGPQPCNSYPEKARIFISGDGVSWTDKGVVCQDGQFDIFPLPCINFVKIVDESNPANFPSDADGFDVDGIQCISNSIARMATDEANNDLGNNAKWISKSVSLFPNPAENQLSVNITGADDNGRIQVNIFDNVGRNVKSMELITMAGNFKFDLPIAELKSGLYNVVVKGKDLMHSAKIVKK